MNGPAARHAWHDVETFIPTDFVLTNEGLFRCRKGNDLEWIADCCWVSTATRGIDGTDAGCVICWLDPRSRGVKQLAIANRRFYESGNALVLQLADLGMQIVPGAERALLKYLGSFRLPASKVVMSASRLGWNRNESDRPVFVLPQRTIGIDVNRPQVIFQPKDQLANLSALQVSGSLENWQHHVVRKCIGHPLLVFALSAAFAAPLLRLVKLDSGGFHFYGASSKGKTTLLQAAASVWGNGADSAVSHDSYLTRWNSTANAFEATAVAYNDLLLPLDELGTCDARDVGKVVYDLFGGRGKSRLTKESTLQAQRTWQTLVLSTGEISLRDKIQENSSRLPHAGQLARMSDIPMPDRGIIEAHDENSARNVVQGIKEACGQSYGVAGPTFLTGLIDLLCLPGEAGAAQSFVQLGDTVIDLVKAAERQLAFNGLESHQQRVMRRIAVCAVGGQLAAELGVVPIAKEQILDAARYVRDLWLGDDNNVSEDVRGINALREFILHNEDRFREAKDDSHIVHNIVGYKTAEAGTTHRLYLLTTERFKEICRQHRCSSKTVIQAVKNRGLLYVNETRRLTSKHCIEGVGRPHFYAIRASIVDGDDGRATSEAIEAISL